MSALQFNAVTYANKLKSANDIKQLADIIAEEQSNIINNDLSTKTDLLNLESNLKKDLTNLESTLKKDLTIRLGAMMFTATGFLWGTLMFLLRHST